MEQRSSPLWPLLALWIAFAMIVATSVFTVLIPELSSDEPEQEEQRSQPSGDS